MDLEKALYYIKDILSTDCVGRSSRGDGIACGVLRMNCVIIYEQVTKRFTLHNFESTSYGLQGVQKNCYKTGAREDEWIDSQDGGLVSV